MSWLTFVGKKARNYLWFDDEFITFSFTGAVQNVVVPAGKNNALFVIKGAGGGGGMSGTDSFARARGGNVGGNGGKITGQIAVTPGETLKFWVGGGGPGGAVSSSIIGGFGPNGTRGGDCASFTCSGAGGGASLIMRVLTALIGAGGGGGGASNDPAGFFSAGGVGGGLIAGTSLNSGGPAISPSPGDQVGPTILGGFEGTPGTTQASGTTVGANGGFMNTPTGIGGGGGGGNGAYAVWGGGAGGQFAGRSQGGAGGASYEGAATGIIHEQGGGGPGGAISINGVGGNGSPGSIAVLWLP